MKSSPDTGLPGTKATEPARTSRRWRAWGRVRSIGARLRRWLGAKPASGQTVEHLHGVIGERAAARFLRRQGVKILLRNYRSRYGEIDLVGREGDVLVFVEVKARQAGGLQRPGEAVTARKRRRLLLTGQAYLRELKCQVPHRHDVVEVYLEGETVTGCRHYRGVFGGG